MSRLENVQILQDSFGAIAKNSQMRFKWALYVILSNDYDTQRNLLPSNNLGNLREILNQMGKKLQNNRPDYFFTTFPLQKDQIGLPGKAIPEQYYEEQRHASDLVNCYANDNNSTFLNLRSSDPNVRKNSYAKLQIPDNELIKSVIKIIRLKIRIYQSKQSEYKKSDGISLGKLFNDQDFNNMINVFAKKYKQKHATKDTDGSLFPQDLYIPYGINLNKVYFEEDTKEPADILKRFLKFLQLHELSDKLLILPTTKQNTGHLVFMKNEKEPKPAIFHLAGAGREYLSVDYIAMLAHELGHAFQNYLGKGIFSPLSTYNGVLDRNLVEYPSTLFEQLFFTPEVLQHLGLNKKLVNEIMNKKSIELIHKLSYAEFEYRLYELAEKGKLKENYIGQIWAKILNKYYGVSYSPGELDNSWQYLSSRHLLFGHIFKSYLLGHVLAKDTINKLREDLDKKNWVGTEEFGKKFLELFKKLFEKGPLTTLPQIEKILEAKIQDLIKTELESEIT
ncbi:MAG: M3 family metallopeptidase [Patescibacteria group bacterium]